MARGWVVAVMLSAACSRAVQFPPSLDAIAEGYVRAALQLAQHNPSLVEDWRGPENWRPGPRQPVQPTVDAIERLQRDLAQSPQDPKTADRREYLSAQLRALHLAGSRLLGRTTSFDEEAREGFDVVPSTVDPGLAIQHLDQELAGPGPLRERVLAFKRRFVIAPVRSTQAIVVALDACRKVTRESIALPDDERVEVAFETSADFDAVARYLGGHRTQLVINRDAGLDVTRALHLACHEGYPGHHVQYLLLEEAARQGRPELLLVPAFGRHLFVTEGAAEAGAALAFPPEARAALYRDRIMPAAELPVGDADRLVRVEENMAGLELVTTAILRGYVDNTITQSRAIERLRDEALVPNPESLLAFAERRRISVLAYPEGRAAVRRALGDDGLAGLRRLFVDRPFALR